MLSQQNSNVPKGQIWDGNKTADILANDQLLKADYYRPLIVGYHNGAAIKLSDIADVQDSVENIRAAAFFSGQPCIMLQVFRQPNANIVETNQRIREALPFSPLRSPRESTSESCLTARGSSAPPCGRPSAPCSFP